ncbi:hypothetical protein [Burkholderia cepacia]|uniref:hypothetical protein n=1 Tax=Burkholderia cepacia TaxID=292 RepID=UPI00158EA9F8|nr:hypothetical protein [Burkholderia cepacia]
MIARSPGYQYGMIVGSDSDFAQRVTATDGPAGELTSVFATRRLVTISFRGMHVYVSSGFSDSESMLTSDVTFLLRKRDGFILVYG